MGKKKKFKKVVIWNHTFTEKNRNEMKWCMIGAIPILGWAVALVAFLCYFLGFSREIHYEEIE